MIRTLAIGLVAAGLAAAPALAQQRDGTPGNPPSTATQRALDRATGSPPTPADATPGNPPGTAAGRAVDRTVGTNASGANPHHRSAMNTTKHHTTRTHRSSTATGTGTTTAPADSTTTR
jgi:hypothetical protein